MLESNKNKSKKIEGLIRSSFATNHRKLLILSLFISLSYFPTWTKPIKENLLDGHSAVLINIGLFHLGMSTIWRQRFSLKKMSPEMDDRLLGYTFLIGGAVLFFLCRDSITFQAFSLMIMAVGAALSSFGSTFFTRFPFAFLMIMASIYPGYHFISNKIWTLLMGPYFLENIMATFGGGALRFLGYSSVTEGRFIFLSSQGVEVLRGCSGFDMAFEIACFSVILGLILKRTWPQITLVTVTGVLLALAFNVPRIILLTLAVAYWDDTSFDFWHGFWGGQIFSATMFTIYYYIAMAIYNGNSKLSG